MNNYTTQAINLKSHNLNESDKIISMYSRDHGIIRCVAKGVKKPTSKLGGRMDMLIANKLFIAKGKNLDIVCQAESVDHFKPIRKNITKLTYSIYLAELINTFGMEHDSNSSSIYDIFFESLKNISLAQKNEEILWIVIRFQLKLMQLIGYAVEVNTCVKCNESISVNVGELELKPYKFSPEAGGIVCNNCRKQVFQGRDVDRNILKTFRDAISFDFPESSAYDNEANQITLSVCFNILKEYISLRSHRKLKSPELIESLC